MLRLVPAVPIPRRNPLSLLVQGLAHKQEPIKTKGVGVTQLAKHLPFLPALMWVLGRVSPSPSSQAHCWNRNGSAELSQYLLVPPLGLMRCCWGWSSETATLCFLLLVFQFLSYWRRNFLASGGRAKGEITVTRVQTTCLESGQRLKTGRQQDGEILICTKISTSCLHPPAHAMVTKLRRCVKCLQRESLMAALRSARSAPGTGALS